MYSNQEFRNQKANLCYNLQNNITIWIYQNKPLKILNIRLIFLILLNNFETFYFNKLLISVYKYLEFADESP
ncbi:hypothetical protein LEP1GSC171_3914 [Leptospira santarosai str. HAI1380]|uniref:Uncharacterized protein n=1 Tax=Leptospira santarosai str. MOR084 TaxID=1049984 RepID=A0A0E2BDF4_9LEPT|nr:hypothetical protein LEP1GSC179_2783 [Leptospira santarosai str. MOR084]EMP01379.1 hypothetical protein LEP1GSC171_3914 [Leptospira santarosai str. HAI1380]EMP79924.1 hypothetical protein LEP1GSC162_1050 [Leptospira santarosai str. CBC1531]OLY61806.1 hypothetical protein BV917_02685 [Leptospira santarosai serovar Guaricura]